MLIGISSEIERIKEEISKRKCNVYVCIFINVTVHVFNLITYLI